MPKCWPSQLQGSHRRLSVLLQQLPGLLLGHCRRTRTSCQWSFPSTPGQEDCAHVGHEWSWESMIPIVSYGYLCIRSKLATWQLAELLWWCAQYLTPFKDSWPEFIHVHGYLSNYILPACVWCSKLSSLSSWSAAAKGKRSFKRVMAMLCIVEGWSAMITTCCNVDDLLNSTVRLQSLVLSNYKVSSGFERSKACSGKCMMIAVYNVGAACRMVSLRQHETATNRRSNNVSSS